MEYWQIRIIRLMTKSSGRHIQSFLLTAFVKPRSTRFPKKPASPPEQSTQDTRIKTHCLSLCYRIFEAMKVMFAPVAKEYEKAITLSRHATFHVLAKVRIIRRYILFIVTHDYEFLNRACNCYIQIERVSEPAERKSCSTERTALLS